MFQQGIIMAAEQYLGNLTASSRPCSLDGLDICQHVGAGTAKHSHSAADK